MKKLLHIDASILGANSVSRRVSAAVVESLRQATPGVKVTYRDLAAAPLPHLSGDHLAAAQGAVPESPALQKDMTASQAALDEFLAADIVVIGAPMYNFTVPSQLKAWIDRILVAGKTFRYSAAGPEGLAGAKRVIVAVSRGGVYAADTPQLAAEHLETYLRAVFGLMGIAHPEIIVAEGVQMGPSSARRRWRARCRKRPNSAPLPRPEFAPSPFPPRRAGKGWGGGGSERLLVFECQPAVFAVAP